ncbi:glycoside hydrolase family 3 protein, partial [Candidatus Bathyarchaeota archaeon]
GKIGGIILFERNVDSPRQLAELTESLHREAKYPLLIAIDQEGGTVARLRTGYTESPGAMALGAADDPSLTERVSSVLATELRALGINWNLAPAIDLTHNIHNPSVGTRSIGTDPEHVTRHTLAQIKGFQGNGVAATAKHFPGKANTPVDPHVELPVIMGKLDQMWDTDLATFRAASNAGVAAILITHAQFKDIEPTYPSTMSPRIIRELLRERIGYRGLITTDCMTMKAVSKRYGAGESAVLAAIAGANIILFSHTREYQEEAYDALLEAAQSGYLPREQIDYSVQCIMEVKQRYPAYPKPSLKVIRQPEHLETTLNAARAGTVMLREKQGALPLTADENISLIEFASNIEQETLSEASETILMKLLKKRLPKLRSTWLDPSQPTKTQLDHAEIITENAGITIIATRNAHLNPKQLEASMRHLRDSNILVCLRNPYDAGILEAETILLTLGDSTPSLQAATEALMGDLKPSAELHVPLTMKK